VGLLIGFDVPEFASGVGRDWDTGFTRAHI
jgi:hypothetical protein